MVLEMTSVLQLSLRPNEQAQGLFHQVEGARLVHREAEGGHQVLREVEGAHQVVQEAVVGHHVFQAALEEKVHLEGEVVRTLREEETELHLE